MAVRRQILNVRTMRRRPNSKWSAWQRPVLHPKPYTMFCCDCALCHQFQFKIVTGPRGAAAIQYRVSRADLYTQMKRKHKSEKDHIHLMKKGERLEATADGVYMIVLKNALRRGGGKRKKKRSKGR